MSLWKSTDQANSAPKYYGVSAKQKAWSGQANIATTGTFNANLTAYSGAGAVTTGSAVLSGLPSTQNVFPGQVLYSTAANTTGGSPTWSNGTYTVLNVINTTALTLSSNSNLTNASVTFVFTTGRIISALASVTGVAVNHVIVANNISTGALVTGLINSTAVVMSQNYTGATQSAYNVTFDYNHITGYNLYNNTTPNAFQNNQAVGVFNILNIPNYVTVTANTIAGNNLLTNPTPAFANTQTGALTLASATMTGLTTTNSISVGMAIYGSAANTGGGGTWSNAGAYAAVANVINSTAITLTAPSPVVNGSSTFFFSKIALNAVASGNGLPTIPTLNGTLSTANQTIVATIGAAGTVGTSGNVLTVSSFTGPPLALGQELLANATSGATVANGTYVTAILNASNGIGTYQLSASSIANGAAGVGISIPTVLPRVVAVNATVVTLSSNAYATGSNLANTVNFSTYEQSAYGRSQHSGWNEVRWGSGPVTTFTVNSTSTTGYSNGETVIVSGGSVNALGTITTNTVAGTAGANVASVAVTYPGGGFTNTSVTSLTYQRQIHVANVTATGTPTGYVVGDKVTVIANTTALASFTGVVANYILTASSVTGTIAVGNLITGTGVAIGTQILAQLTGTAGGAGTYAVSNSAQVASTAMTMYGQIIAAVANITSTSVANGVITVVTPGLFASGTPVSNLTFNYSNSTGGGGLGSGITFTGSFAATASAGAAVNPTLGGKSGRQYVETLVAFGGTSPYISENAADNSIFPNS